MSPLPFADVVLDYARQWGAVFRRGNRRGRLREGVDPGPDRGLWPVVALPPFLARRHAIKRRVGAGGAVITARRRDHGIDPAHGSKPAWANTRPWITASIRLSTAQPTSADAVAI